MKKVLVSICGIFLIINLAGCAALVVGSAAGVVGGYAASKDAIEGETDKPYDTLWSSALQVVRIRGTIKKEDYTKGQIDAIASDSSLVWIKFTKLTESTTKIKISSRKFHFPNLKLAQDIYTKIMDNAK